MEWTLHNCASMLKCQTMFIRGKNGEDAREVSHLLEESILLILLLVMCSISEYCCMKITALANQVMMICSGYQMEGSVRQ